MVEQWTHKPLVVGSNPTLATQGSETAQAILPGQFAYPGFLSAFTIFASASTPPTFPGKTI